MNNKQSNYIPYGIQNITESDMNSIINIIKSDFLTQGPTVKLFNGTYIQFLKSPFVTDIDTEEDWESAEYMYKSLENK
tara:strand:- start:575 stop:808 length:234 start_codon:yes stop_codon:yes gene_type:complete